MTTPVLDLRQVRKTYATGAAAVEALRGVDLVVEPGSYVAVMGPSGSGKSTLMHIVGCLDVPSAGQYLLQGSDVSRMDERRLAHVRNREIGFVFQQFNLLPSLTAQRNVELPLVYAGVRPAERRARAREALDQVGLGDRVEHRPGELSGGQQQRVVDRPRPGHQPCAAAGRRTDRQPRLGVDRRCADPVRRPAHEGRTLVLITHEHDVAARAERSVYMFDGRLSDELPERVA